MKANAVNSHHTQLYQYHHLIYIVCMHMYVYMYHGTYKLLLQYLRQDMKISDLIFFTVLHCDVGI